MVALIRVTVALRRILASATPSLLARGFVYLLLFFVHAMRKTMGRLPPSPSANWQRGTGERRQCIGQKLPLRGLRRSFFSYSLDLAQCSKNQLIDVSSMDKPMHGSFKSAVGHLEYLCTGQCPMIDWCGGYVGIDTRAGGTAWPDDRKGYLFRMKSGRWISHATTSSVDHRTKSMWIVGRDLAIRECVSKDVV